MNNYFCVMPFYGAEYTPTGFTTPCCLLDPTVDIKDVQNDMLNSRRSPACDTCWKLEDRGKVSDRMLKNSAFDFFADKDIQYIEEDCKNGNFSPKIIKLYTSNLCNSTCVTCNSHWSTAWATLKNVKMFKVVDQTIIDSFVFKDFVMLNFVGGEPLKEKKNFDILSQLIAVNNTDCFISITTNGSVALSDSQRTILKQFKNLDINLSIDGIEKRFEYIRYPLSWDILLENLEFFRKNNNNISISYTVSNLSIFYIEETLAWFNSQGISHNYNIVYNPIYFSPNALPLNIKRFLGANAKSIIEIDKHSVEDDKNFLLCCQELRKQDRMKGININDYLPEFSQIMISQPRI